MEDTQLNWHPDELVYGLLTAEISYKQNVKLFDYAKARPSCFITTPDGFEFDDKLDNQIWFEVEFYEDNRTEMWVVSTYPEMIEFIESIIK
jgi:hypothetical protein